jgi:hypothetical protein
MAKQNGNGNGDGKPPVVETIAAAGAGGAYEMTDLVELQVVCAFLVQKLGKANQQDITEKLAAIGALASEHLLHQALEGLRGRAIISYATGRKAKGDVSVHYRMRRSEFAPALEIAHISDLLPRLVETPEARALMAELNGQEAAGPAADEVKNQRLQGYDHYVEVQATFLTLGELLGGQPASPWLDELVARSAKLTGLPVIEADLRFWRDHATGKLQLNSDALRGWVRTGLRLAGYSEVAASYVGVSDALLDVAPGNLHQVALPVISDGKGCGVSRYEMLAPKQKVTIRFRLPTRGLMTPRQFKCWLAAYAPAPLRGCSPARGARFGKMVMIAFEELGRSSDAGVALGASMRGADAWPDEAKAFYAGLLAEAMGVDLRKGRAGASSGD